MLTWTPEKVNPQIITFLTCSPLFTPEHALSLTEQIFCRKHERPCHLSLVPISYAHCIISTQQPFIMQVWHINYCWWQRERENLFPRKEKEEIPHNSTQGCSKCQPVSGCVCLPLCRSRCPRVAICHVCPLCVPKHLFAHTHFLTPHTYWEH